MATVEQILNLDIPSPSWSYRPTQAAPLRSDMKINRGSARDTFSPQKNFETKGVDTPRIYGTQGGLLKEAAKYQEIQNPNDLTASSWDNDGVNIFSGSQLGLPTNDVREDTSTGRHRFTDSTLQTPQGANVGWVNVIRPIRSSGRTFRHLYDLYDGANNTNVSGTVVSFDFSNESASVKSEGNSTVYEANMRVIERTGDNKPNWYIITSTAKLNSGIFLRSARHEFEKDGTGVNYTGDGTSGVDVLLSNVFTGGYQPHATLPVTQTGSVGKDRVELEISQDKWNDSGGTWVFEIVPRFEKTPFATRFFSNSKNCQLFLTANDSPPYKASAKDTDGPNTSVNVTPTENPILPNQVNTICLSFQEGGVGGIAANGEDSGDVGDLNDGFLYRPDFSGNSGDELAHSSFNGSFVYRSVRYIPSFLNSDQRKVISS